MLAENYADSGKPRMRCKNSVRDNLSGKTAKGRYFDRRIDTGGGKYAG